MTFDGLYYLVCQVEYDLVNYGVVKDHQDKHSFEVPINFVEIAWDLNRGLQAKLLIKGLNVFLNLVHYLVQIFVLRLCNRVGLHKYPKEVNIKVLILAERLQKYACLGASRCSCWFLL